MAPPTELSTDLQFELRALEQFAHPMEKTVRRCTVDSPVIVGQCEVHNGSYHQGIPAVHGSNTRPLGDLPHPQDRDLRLVDDRKAIEIPVATRIRDREGSALEFVGGESLGTRPARKILDGLREAHQREPVRVAHDRDDQPIVGLDRNADVEIDFLHDRIAENRGVEPWEFVQRADRRVFTLLELALQALLSAYDDLPLPLGLLFDEDGRLCVVYMGQVDPRLAARDAGRLLASSELDGGHTTRCLTGGRWIDRGPQRVLEEAAQFLRNERNERMLADELEAFERER